MSLRCAEGSGKRQVRGSRPLRVAAVLAVLSIAPGTAAWRHYPASGFPLPPSRVLRVCADPNNLPFSNERGEGFENKIAELVARELGARLEYTWWAQRRGFVRNTLAAGACDVLMGVP